MKIALALIVKGTDEEAIVLERCLQNVAPYVDGIFITATYKQAQKEADAVWKVARKYGANISWFKWQNDFAKARNANFASVPKDFDYILWCDADDMWRGLEKLRTTIEENKTADGFGVWYLYDWDEFKKPVVVHRKTMVIKNDGAAEWVGALHEDLEPKRQLDIRLIEGIDRCHITSPERFKEAAKRNLEIAQSEVKLKPDDPRTFWNLANSQFAIGQYKEASETFREFIKNTHSEDEKYLAYCRLADISKSLGDMEGAVTLLQTAIGISPTIPDAYFQLAHLFYTTKSLDKAEEYCLHGMMKKPQLHKMIVYNPRDYDYNPMMLMAQIYYQKNRPDLMLPMLIGCLKIYPRDERLKQLVKEGTADKNKLEKALKKVQILQKIKNKEKLLKEIEKLSPEIASHPAIAVLRNVNFKKTKSSGRDLVIYCGNTGHTWYDGAKGFIGGSEEAVINLAREWAKLGWNVTVYNNCGHKELVIPLIKSGGVALNSPVVTYKPFWMWNYRDKQDVVILWRWAKPLDAEINAPKIFVDLHDVVPAGEFTESRLAKVTKVMVKTKFHRSLFPNIPNDKIAIIPNGMDMSLFTNDFIRKDPMLMINTSSPDRSMDVLPKLFKQVKKTVPKAKLQWAYGWEVYKTSYAYDLKKVKWMEDTIASMKEAGIQMLGRLSQEDVAKLYQRASILAYPTEFAEIDCISVKKAQAAHCFPITTDFGALKESVEFGGMIHSNKNRLNWNKPYQFSFGIEDEDKQRQWVAATIHQLKHPKVWSKKKVDEWKIKFEWSNIAVRWNELLCAY